MEEENGQKRKRTYTKSKDGLFCFAFTSGYTFCRISFFRKASKIDLGVSGSRVESKKRKYL